MRIGSPTCLPLDPLGWSLVCRRPQDHRAHFQALGAYALAVESIQSVSPNTVNLNLIEVEEVGRCKPELHISSNASSSNDQRVSISPAERRIPIVEEQTLPSLSIMGRVDDERVSTRRHPRVLQRVEDPNLVNTRRRSEISYPPGMRLTLSVESIRPSDDAADGATRILLDGLPLRPLADRALGRVSRSSEVCSAVRFDYGRGSGPLPNGLKLTLPVVVKVQIFTSRETIQKRRKLFLATGKRAPHGLIIICTKSSTLHPSLKIFFRSEKIMI